MSIASVLFMLVRKVVSCSEIVGRELVDVDVLSSSGITANSVLYLIAKTNVKSRKETAAPMSVVWQSHFFFLLQGLCR